MLQQLTVYELKNIIRKGLWDICSDSTGSIQFAMKKLFIAEMVVYDEYVERGVNKKRYSITDKGRDEFLAWVQTPADITGASKMELSKLLFMGFVPAQNRLVLIDALIKNTEEDLERHLHLQSTITASIEDAKKSFVDFWGNNLQYHKGTKNVTQNSCDNKNLESIAYHQLAFVQFIIDSRKYEIEWFQKFKEGRCNIFVNI